MSTEYTDRLNELFSKKQLREMAELTEKIRAIDLDSLASPAERLAKNIREGKALGRRLKKLKERKKPKQTRAMRLRKRREYHRMYRAPKRKATMADKWELGDTWGIALASFKARGLKVHPSEEEWMEHVHPLIVGSVFTCNRYATALPWTLDNMFIVDEYKNVLFDGKELEMRKLGYII